ncbi:MAG: MFS transporter [Acidiferrobacterales bacterium]|nr:MFS transporter [Acidiferrobacterales bacterium]
MTLKNRWITRMSQVKGWLQTPGSALVWLFAALSMAAILSQFYRTSTAVIAPDLRRDLQLTPEALGILTGAFFIAFACNQVPAGMLIDRYGPRSTISLLLLVAIAGAVAFASAASFEVLVVARVLMGLGCSGIMMAAFIICSRWFAARNFTLIISVLLAISNAGVLLATAPMASAVDAMGWRGTFWVTAIVTLIAATMVYLRVRDAPPGHAYYERRRESAREMLQSMVQVFTNRQLPFVLAITFVSYGTLVTVLALWGAPYLVDVHKLDRTEAGQVLFVMVLAAIVGNVVYGVLERLLHTRKRLILAGGTGSATTLALLASLPQPGFWIAAVLLTLFSGFTAFSAVIIAHGRSLFADHLVGRGMTTANIFTMLGAGALQVITGMVAGAFSNESGVASENAYRAVFATLAAILVLALLIYSGAREIRRSHYEFDLSDRPEA